MAETFIGTPDNYTGDPLSLLLLSDEVLKMTTTMVKKFVESQSSTNLMVQVEATLIANVSGTMADYTPESFVANVVDTKVHSTGRVLALVAGRYLCDGTGTLPLNAYAPFVVLLSTGKTILASEQPDWANGGGFEIGLSASVKTLRLLEISTSGLV